jgi:hypothetical protein
MKYSRVYHTRRVFIQIGGLPLRLQGPVFQVAIKHHDEAPGALLCPVSR